MKILIVSATYPPAATATAAIIDNLVKCFVKSGCQVDALTTKSFMKQSGVSTVNDSTVYRADYAMYDSNTKLSVKDIIFKVKHRLHRKFNKNKRIYEEDMVRSFLKVMKSIDMKSYDVIISVCAFYSVAEAVVRYKEQFGLNVKTALYQVDPISDNSMFSSIPLKEREKFEKRLFENNDVIFTTPIIYSKFCDKSIVDKMVPLEFPLITPKRIAGKADADKTDKEIIFVFAGYIYPSIRNPKYTLDFFSSLKNLNFKLYIIGSGASEMVSSYEQGALKGKLVCLGRQPSNVCNEWFEKADVLVNISNSVPNQVPSKVFQYVSYGKPILNIYKLKNSPCLKYLGEYPLAVNVFEENAADECFVDEIASVLKGIIGKRISPEQIKEQYKYCTPEYVAGEMIDILKKLL